MRNCIYYFLLLSFFVLSVPIHAGDNPKWDEIPNLEDLLKEGKKIKKGTLVKAIIKDVQPLQGAVGMDQVNDYVKDFSKMSKDEFREYRLKHIGQIVLGPPVGNAATKDGVVEAAFIDGHHKALATINSEAKRAIVEIQGDYSDLTPTQYKALLKKNKWVWLKDEAGNKISFEELPKSIIALKDDPYRSFVGKLMEETDLIADSDVPFQEFKWADRLRKEISEEVLLKDPKKAMELAEDFAKKKAYRYKLPGAKKYDSSGKVVLNKKGAEVIFSGVNCCVFNTLKTIL